MFLAKHLERTERVIPLDGTTTLGDPRANFAVLFAMLCDFRSGKNAGRSIVTSRRFNAACVLRAEECRDPPSTCLSG